MSDFDFKNVSDSLYSSFIARDFFAKVLPGSIVLAATALSFLNYDTLTQKVKDLPLMFGLLLYGLAWIVGFAVQAIAETLRLTRSFPSDETEDVFRARMTEYRALEMKPSLALQRERYVVIKEATGNTGVADPRPMHAWYHTRLRTWSLAVRWSSGLGRGGAARRVFKAYQASARLGAKGYCTTEGS